MSVPQSQRPEHILQLHVKARNHAAYVIQITKNPKVFDPAYATAITDKMIKLAIDIFTNLWSANNVLVKDSLSYKMRHEYQEYACLECNNLLAMIDIAYKLFHLTSSRVKFWSGWVIDIRNGARAWIQSDAKRYEEYR